MNIDFAKMGGLVPAIIQDSYTSKSSNAGLYE